MAKGEQKGNRESKKPREEMVKTIAAAPSQKGRSSGLATDIRIGQEKIETNGSLLADRFFDAYMLRALPTQRS
jgi:hypothetical protein